MPSKGTPVRTVRIADDLWDAALSKSAADGRTMRDVIEAALRRYVAARKST